MSERGSFTTEYIYNDEDYEIIREALDQKRKYLCISPPATWTNGEGTVLEMPIVSGKVGELTSGWEYKTLESALENVKTHNEVRIIVMCDSGDIYLMTKTPEGEVDYDELVIRESGEDEDEECEIEDYEVDIFKHSSADGVHTKAVWQSGTITEDFLPREKEND